MRRGRLEEAVSCCLARAVGRSGAHMRKKCGCESLLESVLAIHPSAVLGTTRIDILIGGMKFRDILGGCFHILVYFFL
jgi:hypothetical protein